jgi:adenosine deaminase
MGLHTVAHAGEWVGPESIWGAIRHLKVERIGHGTTAGKDPALVDYLREHRLPLEMCPVSNVRTASVKSLREHPIREYFDEGLLVTVNSDDPALFHTSLNNEYIELHRQLGFTFEELKQISLNGIEASFMDNAARRETREIFMREFQTIQSKMNPN